MTDKKEPLTPDDYKRIAESIERIADVGKRLALSGLNQKAIVLLLHDATGVTKRDISLIINELPLLALHYTNMARTETKR